MGDFHDLRTKDHDPEIQGRGAFVRLPGRTGKFLGILLLGTFLSIITLGICLGWFLRKAVSYLASETSIDGEAPRFLGKAGNSSHTGSLPSSSLSPSSSQPIFWPSGSGPGPQDMPG